MMFIFLDGKVHFLLENVIWSLCSGRNLAILGHCKSHNFSGENAFEECTVVSGHICYMLENCGSSSCLGLDILFLIPNRDMIFDWRKQSVLIFGNLLHLRFPLNYTERHASYGRIQNTS